MASFTIDDFSGGLNLRDSANLLKSNESPDAFNVWLDERGGIKRRNGCTNVTALPGTTGTVADIFYSEALNLWLCVRESTTKKLFSRPGDLSGSWTDRGQIASSVSARAVFADWPGTTAYVIIGTDIADGTNGGIYTFDAAFNLVKRSATATRALAVWQNKVWQANSLATLGVRLSRSAVGDPTTWGDFTDLRDKDGAPITALVTVSGALIVFKERSTYRVTDAATGAYSMIDGSSGCVNPRALVALRGRIYAWGTDGLYESDGIGALKNVGDKLRPCFTDATTLPATICAGAFQDRAIFAGTIRDGDEAIEFDPRYDWGMRHTIGGGADQFTSLARKGETLYAAVADGDDLFSVFTAAPTLDNATNVDGGWRTYWVRPNSGMLARLQRLRVQGLIANGSNGGVTVIHYKDWVVIPVGSFSLTSGLLAGSAEVEQCAADIQSLGHGASFAFDLGLGSSSGAAAVSIRALQLIDTPLQWPSPGYPKSHPVAIPNTPPPPGPVTH